MTFGGKIIDIRENKGWTQIQLATKSGLPQPTISRIESGACKNIKIETLDKLSEALGVSIDYLAGRVDELKPSDIIRADSLAEELFNYYSRFNQAEKQQVVDFAKFINTKQQKR